MSNQLPFYKMNGLGNQIVVVDARGSKSSVSSAAAVALASENAVPFDQLMEIRDCENGDTDQLIRILNCDGSQAGACGNGTRCVVAYLRLDSPQSDWRFEIMGQTITAVANDDGTFTVDMGIPRFRWDEIPLEEEFGDTTGIELQIGPIDNPVLHTPSVANMGNPHAVFWVNQPPESYDLAAFGPLLENHPVFPDRANITLAQVLSPSHIVARTWERGTGLTQACGSAACAVLVCAVRKEMADRRATITVPGGDLTIEWSDNNHVMMTGPAEFEFRGMVDPDTGTAVRDRVRTG